MILCLVFLLDMADGMGYKKDKGNEPGDSLPSDHNLIFWRYAAMTEIILTKICTKCKIEKPLSEFYKNKATLDGLQYMCKICVLEYHQSHKKEKAKYYREYHENNKEELNAYARMYHENNKEELNAYALEYNKTHKEEIAEYQKAYFKTDKGKSARSKAAHKRRAIKIGSTVEDFSPIEVFERDGYICQACGCKTRPEFKNQYHPKKPHLDHIIPLSLGGEHSRRNTQTLCAHCNLTKSNTGKLDQLRMFG